MKPLALMTRPAHVLLLSTCLLSLVGCDRSQQLSDTVINRETGKNFIRPGETQPPIKQLPMITGKAQIPAAPIPQVKTRMGRATVKPVIPKITPMINPETNKNPNINSQID